MSKPLERTALVYLHCGCRVALLSDNSTETTICSGHAAEGLPGVAPQMIEILEGRLQECCGGADLRCRDCPGALALAHKIKARVAA